jgi:polyisoprenoid-binding protein YceI
MFRTLIALALGALLATSSSAADTKYPLTGDTSKITFIGTKPKGKHEGGFKKLNGTATVTDGNLETLKIEVEIDTDSLYSDDAKLTTHLKSSDFFDVKEHPKAKFKTTKVEKAEKVFNVTGELTMLGKTETIVFPATIVLKDDALAISTTFPIDRTKWGMNYGKGMIDDKVTLSVGVGAKKAQ